MSAPKQMTEEQKLKLKQKEERRLAFVSRQHPMIFIVSIF